MSHRRPGEPIADYFARAVVVLPNGCWEFPQIDRGSGYGVLHDRATGPGNVLMHRWSFEHFRGPIPEGMQIDHLCHTRDASCLGGHDCLHRRCVNPEHLEPVTLPENVLRGRGPFAENARKTHCKRNHALTPDNTYIYRGTRSCRACKVAATRRWRETGSTSERTSA